MAALEIREFAQVYGKVSELFFVKLAQNFFSSIIERVIVSIVIFTAIYAFVRVQIKKAAT